jgi:hypothetical protein
MAAIPGPNKAARLAPYLVGDKLYGAGRSNPTMGPVDKLGYRERDAKASSRRNALLRQMKANVKGDYMSADSLRRI